MSGITLLIDGYTNKNLEIILYHIFVLIYPYISPPKLLVELAIDEKEPCKNHIVSGNPSYVPLKPLL